MEKAKAQTFFSSIWTATVAKDVSALHPISLQVNQTLKLDPKQPAAVLGFTLLELMHGHADKANSIVAPLVKAAPDNPFYQMAATEIVFQKQGHCLSNDAAIDRLRKIEPLVEGWDEVTVLSQLGCMATLRGFWSYGIPLFVRALRAREQAKAGEQEDLTILWKRNKPSLDKLLEDVTSMDRKEAEGYRADDLFNFDSVPIDTLARAFCILFVAEFAGIREAWPPCLLLASHHQELNRAWNEQKIPDFLIQHCSDWIVYQPKGSAVRNTPFDRN
jgi:hypothetical protein